MATPRWQIGRIHKSDKAVERIEQVWNTGPSSDILALIWVNLNLDGGANCHRENSANTET